MRRRFSIEAKFREPEMKKVHAIGLAAVTFLGLSGGIAVAQTVSGADPYQQGFAAGASAKERNSFDAFSSGYQAGKTTQQDIDSQAASAQAFNNGYQAGVAQGNKEQQLAYNEGYQAHAQQEQSTAARAFDNGFEAGAQHQARVDDEYP
jgi:hypothetical protein